MKIRLLIKLILLYFMYFSSESNSLKIYTLDNVFSHSNKDYSTIEKIDELIKEIKNHSDMNKTPIKSLSIINSKFTNFAYFFVKMDSKILDEIEVLVLNRNNLTNHNSLNDLIFNLKKMPKLIELHIENFGYSQYIYDLISTVTLKKPMDEIKYFDMTINNLINELLNHATITKLSIENYRDSSNDHKINKILKISSIQPEDIEKHEKDPNKYYSVFMNYLEECDLINIHNFPEINLYSFNIQRNKCCPKTEEKRQASNKS